MTTPTTMTKTALTLVLTTALILLLSVSTAVASAPAGPSRTPERMQLVAVQMQLDIADYWTATAFKSKIRNLMQQVQEKTKPDLPTLVVFPEDIGLMLVVQGMQKKLTGATSISSAVDKASKAMLIPVYWTKLTKGLSWIPALFMYRSQVIAQTYFDVFSCMAKEYGVYLIAGSVVLPPYSIVAGEVLWKKKPQESRVYNTSYLFGPDGRVIGRQHKVHLTDLEGREGLDLASGKTKDLQVFDTPLGKIGIAISLDAFHDDVLYALKAQGAQILVQPTANPNPWSKGQQQDWMRSSYNRTFVEKHFAYAVNPMLSGSLWDLTYFGQSSIVAQQPLTPNRLHYVALPPAPGFVALAPDAHCETIVSAIVAVP